MIPAGISRRAVRGFNASIPLSAQRLNAIAALRAVTIHIKTFIARGHKTGSALCEIANVKPIAAKGSAKTV